MPRLDFYVNYELQATIKLTGDEVLIGRDAKCTITIPNEKVSRVHAIIRTHKKGHAIANRGTNGTKVNGRRITVPQALQASDTIFIGRYILIYQPDDAPIVEHASTVME